MKKLFALLLFIVPLMMAAQSFTDGYDSEPVKQWTDTTYEDIRQWKICTEPVMPLTDVRIDGMNIVGWYWVNYVSEFNPRWVSDMQDVAKKMANYVWTNHENSWQVDNCKIYIGQRCKATYYYTTGNYSSGVTEYIWKPEDHWLWQKYRVKKVWKRKGYQMNYRNGMYAWYWLPRLEFW